LDRQRHEEQVALDKAAQEAKAAAAAAEKQRLQAEADEASRQRGPAVIGDAGAAWRRKVTHFCRTVCSEFQSTRNVLVVLQALLRAKEQAKEAGVPLEEFVMERWGSLDELHQAIAESKQLASELYVVPKKYIYIFLAFILFGLFILSQRNQRARSRKRIE
jgi:hypothetical protein